jgi:hypothetical protein
MKTFSNHPLMANGSLKKTELINYPPNQGIPFFLFKGGKHNLIVTINRILFLYAQ